MIFYFVWCLSFFSLVLSQQTEHYGMLDRSIPTYFLDDAALFNSFDKKYLESIRFQPLLFGLLQGIHPYQTLLQHYESQDSFYVMIKSHGSYVYILGTLTEHDIDDVCDFLSCYRNIIVICDESLQGYFVQRGFYVRPRIEMIYNFDFIYHQNPLPEGFFVKKLDQELFEQSPWFGFISNIHGSTERFLTQGIGYGLVNDQGFCFAQAYSAMLSETSCEIGVITHPDYRGNGYIVFPACALIEECLRRNLIPIWSCDSSNTASLKTALKLGFSIHHHYAFIKKDA